MAVDDQGEGSGKAAGEGQAAPRRKRRLKVWAVVGLAVVLLAADLARPPARQVSTAALLFGIDVYQGTLSRLLRSSGAQCRFEPTCSHYGEEAIRKHGALRGSAKAARRVLRCGPWTPPKTVDPP
ncbi:MAG: membrane protein insertion efficiency factor YidD [Deltaproteobacteria bacterium]|nr:membrane protein insertion efficiency factor YidD [Deltaproteobacteria bacterium]